MLTRRELFPNVIEMNFQARRRFGCCVYLVFSGTDWLLVDIGYEDTVDEIIEMIRQMDFPLANCKYLIATHADVDHIQGLARAKQLLRTTVTGHPLAADPLAKGDRLRTFAWVTNPECPYGCGFGNNPHSVRVFCPGRPREIAEHG